MKNDYYVYEWYNVDTDEVFYVGKGIRNRYKKKTKSQRNYLFIKYYKNNKCDVRKVCENMSEEDAFKLEVDLIFKYRQLGQASCNITDGGDGFGENHKVRVVQLNLEGKYIDVWDSVIEATEQINGSDSLISRVCKGKSIQAYGYIWVYEEEYDSDKDYSIDKSKMYIDKHGRIVADGTRTEKPILQYRIDGSFVAEWESANKISKELGYKRSGICGCCKGYYKTCNGYIWRYKETDCIKSEINIDIPNKVPTPIVQLTLDNEYIKTFKDATQAIKELGKKQSDCKNILDVCKGKRKTAYKYKWEYEYNYLKSAN